MYTACFRLHAAVTRNAVLGMFALVVMLVACSAKEAKADRRLALPPTVLLQDDFQQGFDLTKTWALLQLSPGSSADDGSVSTSNQGLYVKAAGTNPLSGEPAF